jgi:hypothetical protein
LTLHHGTDFLTDIRKTKTVFLFDGIGSIDAAVGQ